MSINIEQIKKEVLSSEYAKRFLLHYIEENLKCPYCNSYYIADHAGTYFCGNCGAMGIYEENDIFENIEKYADDPDYIRAYEDNKNSLKNKSKY